MSHIRISFQVASVIAHAQESEAVEQGQRQDNPYGSAVVEMERGCETAQVVAGDDVAAEDGDYEAGGQGCYEGTFAHALNASYEYVGGDDGRGDKNDVEAHFHAPEVFVIAASGVLDHSLGAHDGYIGLELEYHSESLEDESGREDEEAHPVIMGNDAGEYPHVEVDKGSE